jgi:hypothetical protein
MAEEEQSLVEEIFMKENGEMISFMEWGDTWIKIYILAAGTGILKSIINRFNN